MAKRELIERRGMALVVMLVAAVLLALAPLVMRPSALDSYVDGVASRIGYWGDWGTRFGIGEPLALLIDTSMPAGYERLYLRHDGEIVGSLPEAAAVRVRAALLAGYSPRVEIIDLDPLDPARGVRVRLAFEEGEIPGGQPLAGRGLNTLHSVL